MGRVNAMRGPLHLGDQPSRAASCRSNRRRAGRAAAWVLVAGSIFACAEPRERAEAPTYVDDVRPILDARCAACHAGFAPRAGYRTETYADAIGCTADGLAVTAGGDDALLVAVLDRGDHMGLLSPDERAIVGRWLAAGAPRARSGVHPDAFTDPRSPESHGRVLRRAGYRPMLDPDDSDACGRCHAGAPSRGAATALPAAGATPCTTCHTEAGGALACTTCHAMPGLSASPRAACFRPKPGDRDPHAAHVVGSASHASGFPCSTCHPTPALGVLAIGGGTHANGHIDVWFDYAVAGREARWDEETKRCTGTCHARGGAAPSPSWRDTIDANARCGSCHGAPPAGHYRGACNSCHADANADGTALTRRDLHMNGRVDRGDGSGRCGACHGRGDDPWPRSASHPAHKDPTNATTVACVTCHVVPTPDAPHPIGRGFAAVRLTGLAAQRARRPTYDANTKACAGTYCHEGVGAREPAPTWGATTTAPSSCAACHASPPPPPHSQSTSCETSGCHEGSTRRGAITPEGREAHVNGVIDRRVF
jgi:predicted CxxxxCH...CXXCH cytochrome family protein